MESTQFHQNLLLTSLTSIDQPQDESSSAAALNFIRQGQYLQALELALKHLDIAKHCPINPPESASDWFDGVQVATAAILKEDSGAATEQGRLLAAAAVASLYIFTQENLTGPVVTAPESPFDVLQSEEAVAENKKEAEIGRDSMSPEDRRACSLLGENGEDLIGRISFPQYLLLPKLVLLSPAAVEDEGNLPAEWHWWAMRTVLTQQRILAGRSAVLRERLVDLKKKVLAVYCSMPPSEGNPLLASAALLEAAMMETAYGYVAEAKLLTDQACVWLGFQAELGGALGMRTVHQQDARAQLILRLSVDTNTPTSSKNNDFPEILEGQVLDQFLSEGSGSNEEVKGLEDESDVLKHPKLLENDDTSEVLKDLNALQQVAVLALGVHAKKGSSADGLQPWEVYAHADSVLQQPKSEFLLRAAAHLQVTRVERQRSRTRERALLELEGLAEALDKDGSENGIDIAARMRCAFLVWFPLRISLRKELGEAFVALGLVGAALPLFESLELWDNLIICYRLLDKKVAAEQLILRRLEVTPDEPRLWCALGDLSLDDKHYYEAWERSGHRNARAARSLARNAIRKENFVDAAVHWEAALALNPLHPEGWLHLGWCYIKTKGYNNALRALTRAAQIDSENGEAWNNLAAVHLTLENWREAHAALTEAVKHNRNSWHTWDNYAGVAVKIGEWQVAVRALSQVVGLSQGQRLDLEILKAVINQVEYVVAKSPEIKDSIIVLGGDDAEGEIDNNEIQASDTEVQLVESLRALSTEPTVPSTLAEEEAAAAKRSEENFLKITGSLMKQIAGTAAGDSSFWAEYARYYTALGDTDAATECLLKRMRALQGGGWRENEEEFKNYASACDDLCRVYLAAGGNKELSQARMLLRGALKQAEGRYEEHEMFRIMQNRLEEVSARITENVSSSSS